MIQIPDDASPILTGDLILVTGVHSRALVKAQSHFIPTAVSSHVAIAHAETLCIDAVPKDGVRNRFLLDVLENVEPTWRVIRKKTLSQTDRDSMLQAAAFFLSQSYLIHPSETIGKSKSYCSELARKIYVKAGVPITVPQSGLVMPAHFDLLHQSSPDWLDVTDDVRSWVEFLRQNEAEMRQGTSAMIAGLKLNRKRFADRQKMRVQLRKRGKAGKLSADKLKEALRILDDVDAKMSFKFWDVK